MKQPQPAKAMKTLQEMINRSATGPLTVPKYSRIDKSIAIDSRDWKTIARVDNDDVPNGLGPATAFRLAHSYNMLPEVVAELEKVEEYLTRLYKHNDVIEGASTGLTRLRSLIAKANNIP